MDNTSSQHQSGSGGNSTKNFKKSHLNFEQNEKTKHKCNICMQSFSSENSLKEHEEIHVTPFCHVCSKMFKSAKLLRVHHQTYHTSSSQHQLQQSAPHASSKSKETLKDDNNICHDLTLHKIKEEPIDIVSEPEIENLLNHDSHHLSPNPHNSDNYYPEPSKSSLGIWRNFTETPPSSFLDHSSVPLGIKMEPVDTEHDQFDFIINEILKKPPSDGGGSGSSRLSLVAEEISLHQNFWTQSDHQQQDTWVCDICSKTFSTKQILQRHRIATHDQNKDFKCDQCDQWFSSTNNHELIKHVNEVHNGFKKFICDFPGCQKEFSRRDALKRHRSCHEKGNRGNAAIYHPYFRPHLTRH